VVGVFLGDLFQQHLHEQDLEPQARGGDAGDLVLAELDALLAGQLVPQRRPVQRRTTLGEVLLALEHRRGPVDVEVRVVELARRRLQQPFRGLLAIGFLGRSCR
jgi:hypothetical protein